MFRRSPAPLIALAAALATGLGLHSQSSRADVIPPTFTAYNVSSLTSTDISQWTTDPTIQIKSDGPTSAPTNAPSPWSSTPTQWLQYTLTTTQAIPSAGATAPSSPSSSTVPQVLATDSPIAIQPAGGSTTSSTIPLLYVASDSSSSSYYYNNSGQIQVTTSGPNTLTNNGTPVEVQALGLSFYGPGLAAGESIKFDLPFSANVVGTPTPVGQQAGVGGGSTETPEPLSLLLWSALAGAGIWRARARRTGPRP